MINTISKLYVVSTEGMSMHNEDGMWGNIYIYKTLIPLLLNYSRLTCPQHIPVLLNPSASAQAYDI